MKKAILTLGTLASIAFLMIGADFKAEKQVVEAKKHCSGYTIIEAGKGIDCYGDTVRLVKKYGYYELASNYKEEKAVAFN